ncbi:LacI family DNA-binding transcriptional regulator [Mesobacillus sp. AQ2]|uniref:LacI family DNA-binding transcriptional regulator n=1 Tax=Bacillaceae TaxID=186817 RepID=UPI0011A150EC|nr:MULTISPECIES: LacI family DNA-binding transcriptional regulator [Bacillaceae]MCM3121819.1 LacI family DNA-binding transcriptional regulator [Mesobacillus sp. MER 33]MCM3231783.1 LacI family DNA-binding transcriptional regulator [Mesobacillus sp. MER 48]WHX38751.1 LacI family DNA-binding transcriptional regulator [Mesobacillus sp. AQ2]
MANIREIARLAGVSVSTVSRVLNNHPYVSPEKRDAVLETMRKLDYSPNINAVHLSRGRTNMVGVVLPTINHPYFSELLEGIAEEGMNHNIQLVIFQTGYREEKEFEALEQLRGQLIDGVIFASRAIPFGTLMNYKGAGPIVLCEDSDQEEFPSISIKHVDAFNLGLDYLILKGHQKIAICLGRLEGTNSRKRKDAYEKKMKMIGEDVRSEWVLGQCLMIEDGKEVIEQYLKMEVRPTAFIVGNDQVATGMVTEAKKYGVDIPGELAIISFDNHPISEIMDITTISIPTKQLGTTAFQALLKRSEKKGFAKKITLPFQLIERGSV